MELALWGCKAPKDIPKVGIEAGDPIIFNYNSYMEILTAIQLGYVNLYHPETTLWESDEGFPTILDIIEAEGESFTMISLLD